LVVEVGLERGNGQERGEAPAAQLKLPTSLEFKLKAYSDVFFYHIGVKQRDRGIPPAHKATKGKKAVSYAYNTERARGDACPYLCVQHWKGFRTEARWHGVGG